MPSDGIDEALKLEAVYFSTPIPRNLAVLTVLGAVFDKVYFPGVYLPKDGFDQAELDKEIARLEALPVTRGYDTDLLIGILKFTKHASTLAGFCEFTALPDDPFGNKSPVPGKLVQAVYEAIYGPPKPGFIPHFEPKGYLVVKRLSFIRAISTISLERSCTPLQQAYRFLMTFRDFQLLAFPTRCRSTTRRR